MPALRDYDIGMTLRWFDKLHVHRPHGSDVLLDHGLYGAPAFGNITPQTTDKPDVIWRIDEHLDVHLLE